MIATASFRASHKTGSLGSGGGNNCASLDRSADCINSLSPAARKIMYSESSSKSRILLFFRSMDRLNDDDTSI